MLLGEKWIKIKGERKKHEKLNNGTFFFVKQRKENEYKMFRNLIYLPKRDMARFPFPSIFDSF